MSQVLVNFRMDEDDKKGMEEVCHELGMSMTTAFTIFAKKIRREKRIPFDVSIDPFYSEANIRYLNRITSEIESGEAKLAEHSLLED
ncbi:MAG: type II toxin-antitoxin system RelB/DinJ family antitoxin [Clostridia bacterium]|nr:type II toxin-antitoxin system RelB/DinJ family antitoxin [Clostridia bacterium]